MTRAGRYAMLASLAGAALGVWWWRRARPGFALDAPPGPRGATIYSNRPLPPTEASGLS
jgi:hypothetical protein